MFDRFTNHAKGVFNKARQQSQRLNHDFLGTEHILLGLIDEDGCRARSMLDSFRLTPDRLRSEIDKLIKPGSTGVGMGQLPFTPRAKKVLEYSMEEAGLLDSQHIGTEHLLLGLVRETEGVASKTLAACGLSIETARAFARANPNPEDDGGRTERSPTRPGDRGSEAWRLRILEDAVDALAMLMEFELGAKVREVARKHGSRKWER